MTSESITQRLVKHTQDAYESTAYESLAFSQTHPDNLAVMATLSGLEAVPVATARVLELGCASGGNLLPVAVNNPQSECLGIDLADNQIRDGQEAIATLGINNISLRTMDIMDLDEDLGQFDYIICHGVFSWVPPEVREKILDTCHRLLSPNGVAYISYNTYPGWHLKEIPRYLMYRSCDQIEDPDRRYQAAMDLLAFYGSHARDDDAFPMGRVFRNIHQELSGLRKDYVLHEYMEPINTPYYFRDFLHACARHELAYLGSAEMEPVFKRIPDDEVRRQIESVSRNRLELEEYTDFLTARTFRGSLLTHAANPVQLEMNPMQVLQLHCAANLTIEQAPGQQGGYTIHSRQKQGHNFSTTSPLLAAGLTILSQQYPCAVAVDQLFALAASQGGLALESLDDVEMSTHLQQFARDIFDLAQYEFLELFHSPPVCTHQISDQPCLSPVALLQIHQQQIRLTNQKHRIVDCQPGFLPFLSQIDGQHSRQELLQILAEEIKNGNVDTAAQGIPAKVAARKPAELKSICDQLLESMRVNGLLIS